MNGPSRSAGVFAGRSIELVATPSVGALLWALIPVGLFAIAAPVILFASESTSVVGTLLGAAFGGTVVLAGLVFAVLRRTRRVEYRLVFDPRGVFLVDAHGAVEGLVGAPPLDLAFGHWLSGSRSGIRSHQCVLIGGRLWLGTNGVEFGPYRAAVPTTPRPRFVLKGSDWAALVDALPALRALQ